MLHLNPQILVFGGIRFPFYPRLGVSLSNYMSIVETATPDGEHVFDQILPAHVRILAVCGLLGQRPVIGLNLDHMLVALVFVGPLVLSKQRLVLSNHRNHACSTSFVAQQY